MNYLSQCKISVIIILSVGFLCLNWSCSKSLEHNSPAFSHSIIDYIHQPKIHPVFITADSLKWNREYLSAIEKFKNIFQKSKLNLEEKLYCKNQLVYCYLFVGEYESAKTILDELATKMTLEHLSKGVVADYLLNKSKYLQLIGEGGDLLPMLQKADNLYTDIYGETHVKRIETAVELATFYQYYSIEITSLEKEFYYLNSVRSILDRDSLLDIYSKDYRFLKSVSLFIQRKNSEGLLQADFAIRLAKTNPEFQDTAFIARCHNMKGVHYKGMFQMEKALEEFQVALNLGESQVNNIYLQEIYKNLAIYYTGISDTINFHFFLNKMETRFPGGNLANPLRLKAYQNSFQGDYSKSIQQYLKLIKKIDAGLIKYNRFKLYDESYFMISSMYEAEGKLDSSIYYLTKAIFIGDEKYWKDAYSWNDLEDYDFGKSDNQIFVYLGPLASCFAQKYTRENNDLQSLKQALHLFYQTDYLLFNYSLMANDEASLAFLWEIVFKYYPNAIKTAFTLFEQTKEESYLEQANFFMERMKSFSLYRDIYTDIDIQTLSNPLIRKEEKIRKTLEDLKWKRFFDESQKENPSIDQAIQKKLDELEKLYAAYQKDLPLYFSAKMQSNFNPIRETKKMLGNSIQDKAVLQYEVNKENVFVLLIKKDTIVFKKIEKPTDLDSTIIAYQKNLSNSNNTFDIEMHQKYLEKSFQLYQVLIEPIESLIQKGENVLIIPDDQLNQIPFESFVRKCPKNIEQIDYQNLSYLLYDWNIEYANSLKMYLYKQKNIPSIKFPPTILAFADADKNTNVKRNGALRDGELMILPGSEKELLSIQRYFGKKNNDYFFGKESTKHQFFKSLEKPFDIVHLALHAISDNDNWLNSKLYFRDESKNKHKHDPVHGYELASLDIETPLVILSACQTAQGISKGGEGTFSLARSFIKSGAKTVVSSLWDINDQTTSTLMEYFYQELAEEQTIAIALTNAKIAYVKSNDEYLSFPGFWSGMICLN